MGDTSSRMQSSREVGNANCLVPNRCRYETLEQVRQALQNEGLEACELNIAVSFAKSNMWTGKQSFGGKCLHDVNGTPNPYMEALSLIARTLGVYDDDHSVPCYGFAEKDSVFSFFEGNQPARGLDSLPERYTQIASSLVELSGPTSFAAVIRQAMRNVYDSGMKFHLLLILADGQISDACLEDTKKAIIDACAFPLSIVVVGVGDGPWTQMTQFDNELLERSWDNFRFFDLESVTKRPIAATQQRQNEKFEFNALAELPQQYKHVRHLTGNINREKVSKLIKSFPSSVVSDPPCL